MTHDEDRDHRCCWCPFHGPVPSLRKQHEKRECRNRPEGTDHEQHERDRHDAPGAADGR
jgi:hypothetical protein